MSTTIPVWEEMALDAKKYVQNHIEYTKLDVAEKTSKMVGLMVAFTISMGFFMTASLFIGFAIAMALTPFVGDLFWGMLIVAFLYWIIGIIIWKMKYQFLRARFMNTLLTIFHSTYEQD
jgi:hypothetical protein